MLEGSLRAHHLRPSNSVLGASSQAAGLARATKATAPSSRLAGHDEASDHGAGDDGSGTRAFAETAAAAPLLDAHAHPVVAWRNGRPVGAGLRAGKQARHTSHMGM